MTTTAEPTTDGVGQRRPQGGRAADHRPHPLDRQHHAARHAAPGHGAQPVRARQDHRASTPTAAKRAARRRRASSPPPTSATSRAACPTPGRSRRTRRPRRTRRWPSTPCTSPARSSPSSSPATRPRPGTPPSSSTSTTTSCRRCSTWRRRSPRAPPWLHPDLGTNKQRALGLRLRRGRHRRRASTRRSPPPRPTPTRSSIERRFRQQRLIPAFMEPRSVVVDPTGEQITMWSATQIPHILRLLLALLLGIPEHKIRVIAPDVGGGFGGKLQITPEEMLACWPRRQAGQAGQVHRDPLGVADGRPTTAATSGRTSRWPPRRTAPSPGSRSSCSPTWAPTCAWSTSGVPMLGAFMFNAIYKFPAYQFDCTTVFTNKTWTDAYRGAGRPEATFAIERIMDELAAELGLDPLEIREQNWIKHEEFPFTTVAGLEYDSGNYEAATARAKELFGYDALRREQEERRDSRDPVQLGIGVSTFTEMCGLAPIPGARLARLRRRRLGARERSGCCPPARSRSSPAPRAHGQGHETAFSQIVADRLGVPFEDVEVLHGDTQIVAQGPGHLRLALAGRRRRRPLVTGRRQGGREGQDDRRAPARGLRRRPRVRRRPVRGAGHRPGRCASRRWRSRRSRRTTSRTAWSRRSTPTRPSTR